MDADAEYEGFLSRDRKYLWLYSQHRLSWFDDDVHVGTDRQASLKQFARDHEDGILQSGRSESRWPSGCRVPCIKVAELTGIKEIFNRSMAVIIQRNDKTSVAPPKANADSLLLKVWNGVWVRHKVEEALPIGQHDTVHVAFDPSAFNSPRQTHRGLHTWRGPMYRRLA